MRYSESKERTAELLRLALGHMGRHAAAFNPVTFTVWYEYVAGINPNLSASIDQRIKDASSIDDDTVVLLYKKFIAPADEETMKTISSEMERLMASMAQSASQTGDRAGTFGDQLKGLTTALASRDVEQLKPRLTEVMAGTAAMKSSVETLRNKVTASQEEISRLRSDLERARDDAILDPMTGILNRRGFEKRIESLLAQKPADGISHCLVMLDIDHFKTVNDTHGHLMGDRVIQAVQALTADLGVKVEVKNQARVHLWYRDRFQADYPQLTRTTDGIDRYLVACTCVGIDVRTRGLYAPHGLDELQRGVLRMNPRFAQPAMFRAKARSYQARWPWLSVVPAEEERP